MCTLSRVFFSLTEKGYANLRFVLLLLFCVLRLGLVWRHLQSYLHMAHERIEKMKKETGRITNVDLQRKVSYIRCNFALIVHENLFVNNWLCFPCPVALTSVFAQEGSSIRA